MVEELIKSEELKLKSKNDTERSNVIFNLISLKVKVNQNTEIYKLTKQFFEAYINSIQALDYGYDNFNFLKVEKLLCNLNPEQQISILQYVISLTSRELPEYDRSWFLNKKREAEIQNILKNNLYSQLPKAIFTFLALNTMRLLVSLLFIIALTNIVLLPTFYSDFGIFKLNYEIYHSNFYINHFFNIIALFACLDNNFTILPSNFFAFIVIIISKLVFTIFILNFIYIKITDKIILK